MDQFDRIRNLLKDKYTCLTNKTVFLAGLGGVGGTTFEALVRSGISSFVIADFDRVSISNINRQILYTLNDIDKLKVDVAIKKALAINPDVKIVTINDKIDEHFSCNYQFDFIIDCIDDVKAKVALISFAKIHNIPIVSSMGMANKIDPSQIHISSLNKSTVDPLAKKMRYELKKEGIDYSGLMCVYSTEKPVDTQSGLNSLITVTSTAGLFIASYVISCFINK